MPLKTSVKIPASRSPFGGADALGVSFTIGAETGGNTKVVSCQFKGGGGRNLAKRVPVLAYLSDDSAGATPVATAPSGAVTAVTHGAVLDTGAAKKSFLLVPTAAGRVDVQIVEAGAKTLYLNVMVPGVGLVTSGAITFA